MDPLTKIVPSFIKDVNEYLSFVTIYGKPNHKYFNFVINRMGLLYIFLSKTEIFKYNSVSVKFVQQVFIALKKKFLAEESLLRRSAIIFLVCKIYFTDDNANQQKLRITADEWNVFISFIRETENFQEFLTTRIMFYHLYTESFFMFTMKDKALALDYGKSDKVIELDPNQDEAFWKDIRQEVEVLEKCELVELNQLKGLRDVAMEPFQTARQEQGLLDEALSEFAAIKEIIQKPPAAAPSRVSKREISQACRNFLKETSQTETKEQLIVIEEIELNSDQEFEIIESKPPKTKKRKRKSESKKQIKKESNTSSSDSDDNSLDKLKKAYEQT